MMRIYHRPIDNPECQICKKEKELGIPSTRKARVTIPIRQKNKDGTESKVQLICSPEVANKILGKIF